MGGRGGGRGGRRVEYDRCGSELIGGKHRASPAECLLGVGLGRGGKPLTGADGPMDGWE